MTSERDTTSSIDTPTAQVDPFMYDKFGRRQPDYVEAYLRAFAAINPTRPLPIVWLRRNGWLAYRANSYSYEVSMRRSKLEGITGDMQYMASK